MTRQLLLVVMICCLTGPVRAETKWIIAAGAGESWPENCLISLAVALERGADTIKLAVAMNRDDQVVVLADPLLHTFTDVAEQFPEKTREDGASYSLDLSLAELRQLTVVSAGTSPQPNQAPRLGLSGCSIATLTEALDLVELLENEQNRSIGIVIELRKPWLHEKEGRDLAGTVLDTLSRYHFRGSETEPRIYLASHDADELQRIFSEQLSATEPPVGIIQLIDTNDGGETMRFELGRWQSYNYDWLFTKFGLKSISAYTDAIGLSPWHVTAEDGGNDDYLEDARLLGISILSYPVDPLLDNPVPLGADEAALINHLLFSANFDGLMTCRYQTVVDILERRQAPAEINDEAHSDIDRLIEKLEQSDLDLTFPSRPILLR